MFQRERGRVVTEVYVTVDPDICGGKPVIKGTRVPLEFVVKMLRSGLTPERVHEEYPTIPLDIVRVIANELNEKGEVVVKLTVR